MKYLLFMYLITTNPWGNQAQPEFKFGSTPAEFETYINGDISNDGKWVYYYSTTEQENDTLILRETTGPKTLKIPKGNEGKFSDDSKWFVATDPSGLEIVNLETWSKEKILGVNRKILIQNSTIVFTAKAENHTSLTIRNLKNKKETVFDRTTEFAIEPFQNQIAVIQQEEQNQELVIFDFRNNLKKRVHQTPGTISSLKWDRDGKKLVYFLSPTASSDNEIGVYREGHIHSLGKEQISINHEISSNYIELAPGGDYILFKSYEKAGEQTSIAEGIQEWLTDDNRIYPEWQREKSSNTPKTLWAWNPKKQLLFPIYQNSSQEVEFINQETLLIKDSNNLSFKFVRPADFYLYNLNLQTKELFLAEQQPNLLFLDPWGKYIVYFRSENWYSYNLLTKKTENLTGSLPYPFADSTNDRPDRQTAFSKTIKWLDNQQDIWISDRYDIWMFSLNGKKKKRLTTGRESGQTFQIFFDFLNPKNLDQRISEIDKGSFIQIKDENENNGFAVLRWNGRLNKITFGPYKIDQLSYDKQLKFIGYRIQSFKLPPQLVIQDRSLKSQVLEIVPPAAKPVQQYGEQEIIDYITKDGRMSKAVLLKPANYDPEKKYPLIVNIYENQSSRRHDFYPFSDFGTYGFNPVHYTTDGYFVLMPDIDYTIGDPGKSALYYVNESLDAVLQNKSIDPARIGLIGFSFGGYESAFIATQTNRFASIVAGAAVTDLKTYYFTINRNTGREEMWRMEDYQMRMGKSFFEDKESYLSNSPMEYVENLTTPILLWSGAEDYHIDFNESIRFYLALRRLNKKGKLLLFEGEGHNIINNQKRKFLSETVKQWFDNYCKI